MAKVQLQYPGNTLISHEVTVRFGDLSLAAHLGFDYLGLDMTDADQEIKVIVVDFAIQYLSEAFRKDRLRIDMAVGEIRTKGFALYFKVFNQTRERQVALAKLGLVFFDYSTHTAVEIPEETLEKIENKQA